MRMMKNERIISAFASFLKTVMNSNMSERGNQDFALFLVWKDLPNKERIGFVGMMQQRTEGKD